MGQYGRLPVLADDRIALPVGDAASLIDDLGSLIYPPFLQRFSLFFPYSRAVSAPVFAFLAAQTFDQVSPLIVHIPVNAVFADLLSFVIFVPSAGYLLRRPILF